MIKGGSSCLDFFVFNFPEASHCTVRNIFRPQLSILNSITNIPLISITAPDSSHHHLNQTFWTCLKLKLQEKQCWIGCYFNILYWWAEPISFANFLTFRYALHRQRDEWKMNCNGIGCKRRVRFYISPNTLAHNTSIQTNSTLLRQETKPHDWLNKNIGKMKIEKICIHKILQWVLKMR